MGVVTLKLPGKRVQAGSAISVFQLAQVGPFANIPDVHPLADRRTDSRTVETDGDASEIPKRGIIPPSGGLDGWKNTRKVVRNSKESSLWATKVHRSGTQHRFTNQPGCVLYGITLIDPNPDTRSSPQERGTRVTGR